MVNYSHFCYSLGVGEERNKGLTYDMIDVNKDKWKG